MTEDVKFLERVKAARDQEYEYIQKLRTPPKRTWFSWIWDFGGKDVDTTDEQWAAYQRWRWYNDKVTELENDGSSNTGGSL